MRDRPGHRRGTFLMVALPLGVILFLTVLLIASRGHQVRREFGRLRDQRTAEGLAASALSEGLALAHGRIRSVVDGRASLDPPNHDDVLQGLQQTGRWVFQPRACLADIPDNQVFAIGPIEARVPDDTPITSGHIADIELQARVTVSRRGVAPYTIAVRERRAFCLGDETMEVYLGRRVHQHHVAVERGSS